MDFCILIIVVVMITTQRRQGSQVSMRVARGSASWLSSPTSLWGSSSLCRTPGLVCPVSGWNHSLPWEDLCPCNLSFPLSPLPGHRSWPDTFLPTGFHVDISYSLGCTGVFLPVSRSFPVRTVPHVDVFLLCSLAKGVPILLLHRLFSSSAYCI